MLLVGPLALVAWRCRDHEVGLVLSAGLGVLALSALVVAVVLPSRVRTLTRAFGVERVMGAHRWLGMLAVLLVLMHAAIALVRHPALLVPATTTPAARAAWASVLALVLVGVSAARGRRPGARYEWWARLHVALAAAGLVLAGLHVVWLGHLVTDPVVRAGLGLLAAVLLVLLSHRWVWRPLFSRQGAWVVYGVRREGPRVSTLVLAPVHCRRGGLRFSPGQFVWLRLRRGVVGTEEHPFSIASSARVTGRLELTVRDAGDFTGRLAELPVGARVWLDGPHGSFTAETLSGPRHRGLVLLASGVGIAPMMSMLRTLADRRDRRVHRLVVAERGDEPLFADELAALGRRLNLEVTRTGGRRIDAALLADVLPDAAERDHLDYFVCGSASLLAGSLAALEQLAVPADRIHTEQFGWTGAVPAVPAGALPGVPVPAPGPVHPGGAAPALAAVPRPRPLPRHRTQDQEAPRGRAHQTTPHPPLDDRAPVGAHARGGRRPGLGVGERHRHGDLDREGRREGRHDEGRAGRGHGHVDGEGRGPDHDDHRRGGGGRRRGDRARHERR